MNSRPQKTPVPPLIVSIFHLSELSMTEKDWALLTTFIRTEYVTREKTSNISTSSTRWLDLSLTIALDNYELNDEPLLVTYARAPRERDDRRGDRSDRSDRGDRGDRSEPPREIVLHRIAVSNLPNDTTWQVCALRSCLAGVPT